MHVRKVRETDTGGKPTPFAQPLYFEFNSSMSGFGCCKPESKLFTPLGQQLIGKQDVLIT
jgi:hypothetical protein